MSSKKPKDFRLGEVAYESYYGGKPQIPFEDLNHDAHMKWVQLSRRVIEEWRAYVPARKVFEVEDAPPKAVMHKSKKRYKSSRKGLNVIPLEEKVKSWDENDEMDEKLLTGKSPKSDVEIAALARMRYRNKQRVLNGLAERPIG